MQGNLQRERRIIFLGLCHIINGFWRGVWAYYMISAIDGILSRAAVNWKNTKFFEHPIGVIFCKSLIINELTGHLIHIVIKYN
jgi:hypothetical protein